MAKFPSQGVIFVVNFFELIKVENFITLPLLRFVLFIGVHFYSHVFHYCLTNII